VEPHRFYLDTEFNEFGGELISLAMVDGRGREFYEVLKGWGEPAPWVAANVVPRLNRAEENWVSPLDFQRRLSLFFGSLPVYPIEIVADWPEDFTYLLNHFVTGPGMKIDNVPQTLHLTLVDLPDFSSDQESKVPHNALEDARALCRYCTDPNYLPGWGTR
jgi:hypothetical protein